jgi:hypothetical protein
MRRYANPGGRNGSLRREAAPQGYGGGGKPSIYLRTQADHVIVHWAEVAALLFANAKPNPVRLDAAGKQPPAIRERSPRANPRTYPLHLRSARDPAMREDRLIPIVVVR